MHTPHQATMKQPRMWGTALAMGLLLALGTGCQKPAGPMEQAGKDADAAIEKIGQQVEKAGENLQDAAKHNQKP